MGRKKKKNKEKFLLEDHFVVVLRAPVYHFLFRSKQNIRNFKRIVVTWLSAY